VGDDDAVEFYEKRYVRGELPGPVLVAFATMLGGLGLFLPVPIGWRAMTIALAALTLWLSAARIETVVAANRLTMKVPLVWHREIDLADVAAVEVVVTDSWPFGGGVSAALVSSVDPGRDRGTRAVRLELRNGKVMHLSTRDAFGLRDAVGSGASS
jgi:hypothetical protein